MAPDLSPKETGGTLDFRDEDARAVFCHSLREAWRADAYGGDWDLAPFEKDEGLRGVPGDS